jgi:hypothetical protein
MRIPDVLMSRLAQSGLLISEPHESDRLGYPSGFVVAKPASVPGNSLPDYECLWGAEGIPLDAPCLRIETFGENEWRVVSHDYVPGPGPGDFVLRFTTLDEAVSAALDFFFGDPRRMNEKAAGRRPVAGVSPEACLQQGCSSRPVDGFAFCTEHLGGSD